MLSPIMHAPLGPGTGFLHMMTSQQPSPAILTLFDHVVPLKEAWISGARSWTAAQREAFANDLTRPQLVAVTDNLNQAKGDKDVAKWVPPLASFVCTYVRAWVTVKHYYSLTIDSAEKTALTDYLANC